MIAIIGLSIILFATVATLIIVVAVWKQTRNITKAFHESYARLEAEVKHARQERDEAQRKAQQLEEQRPEKLEWELDHANEELERLRRENREAGTEAERQKQGLLHQVEQYKQQRSRLEQETRNLMEELERWRWRYVDAQQRDEQSREEWAQDRKKIEHLQQIRERLLEELREIGNS